MEVVRICDRCVKGRADAKLWTRMVDMIFGAGPIRCENCGGKFNSIRQLVARGSLLLMAFALAALFS